MTDTNTTAHDFIAELDAAIGCQQCGSPLGDSPSNDFCTDTCQFAWSAARVDPLTSYAEPVDEPEYVGNQVELHNPETCAVCVDRRSRINPHWLSQTAFIHDWERRRRDDARRLYLNQVIPAASIDAAAVEPLTPSPPTSFTEALRRMVADIAAASALPPEMVASWLDGSSIAEQALAAERERRNTGPVASARAPRTINPRRRR